MAITKFERASEVTDGNRGDVDARTVTYWADVSPLVDDDANDNDVLDHAELNTPTIWDGLKRGRIQLQQVLPGKYKVRVPYNRKDLRSLSEVGARYNFEIAAETVKTYYAISQDKYGTKAIGHGVAINVEEVDGKPKVQGADIYYPRQEFEYEFSMTLSGATISAKQAQIEDFTGKLNSTPFLGSAIGEVLFMGARGQITDEGDSELTFRFSVRRNPTLPLTIGGITIPSGSIVYGWDYIWVQWNPQEDGIANDIAVEAQGVYVSRVFEFRDLTQLFVV